VPLPTNSYVDITPFHRNRPSAVGWLLYVKIQLGKGDKIGIQGLIFNRYHQLLNNVKLIITWIRGPVWTLLSIPVD